MSENQPAEVKQSKGRIEEIDFLKAVMIVLMVAFHLVYIGDFYPRMKQMVYTFHMPVFLIITGLFLPITASPQDFARKTLRIVRPYLLLESAYIAAATLLPIREHIDRLTIGGFFSRLLLHPIGPYWYLLTMIVGSLAVRLSWKMTAHRPVPTLILSAFLLFLVSNRFQIGGFSAAIVDFPNAMYLLSGVAISLFRRQIADIVPASWLSIIIVTLLFLFDENLYRGSTGGVMIVYFTVSSLRWIWQMLEKRYTAEQRQTKNTVLFIGRNTLPILLFSPIFTVLAKLLIPFVQFDPTRILFLLAAVTLTVVGSIAVARVLDRLGLSAFLFGKNRLLSL